MEYINSKIHESVIDTIGWTPIVRLKSIENYFNVNNKILAKLEYFNPGGSVKDRIGKYMIRGAEKEGKIKEGGVIIEPTSGNTGVGIILAAGEGGYQTVFTMPTKMSYEKELLLEALGGEVIRAPTEVKPEDPNSYYNVAEAVKKLLWKRKGPIDEEELKEVVDHVQDLVDKDDLKELRNILEDNIEPTSFAHIPNQYFNEYNPLAHYEVTGPEIWEQMNHSIDYFFAGIGTGGTITGIGRYLKEKTDVEVIGVDPVGSIYNLVENGMTVKEALKHAEPYLTEGIGEDLIPETFDMDIVDDIVVVDDQQSFSMTRFVSRKEGIFAGGSSGSALYSIVKYMKDIEEEDKRIVTIFPDTGRNYLSRIFNDDWMAENGLETDDEKVLEDLK